MALSVAFVADAGFVVPIVGVVLTTAVLGGPRYNLFAYLYRAMPISAGDLEPAAPPRFSQGVIAVLLALAFLVEAEWAVPVVGALMALAVLGGPAWNLFAKLHRVLRLPSGEPEPAAPPRFSQALGAVFLAVATTFLFAAAPGTTTYWWVGWGPALAVTVLAALAATTSF